MNDKFLLFLGLAKKSGNLVLGMDAVKEGIIKKNINLALTASDVSDSSFEKINLFCEKNNVKTLKISYTMDDIYFLVNKRSGILGIKDANFAKKITSMIEENSNQTKKHQHKEELHG